MLFLVPVWFCLAVPVHGRPGLALIKNKMVDQANHQEIVNSMLGDGFSELKDLVAESKADLGALGSKVDHNRVNDLERAYKTEMLKIKTATGAAKEIEIELAKMGRVPPASDEGQGAGGGGGAVSGFFGRLGM